MSDQRYKVALVVLALGAAVLAPEARAEVVAKVGTKTITLEEVDDQLRSTNMKLLNELYNARRQAVEELVAEHLLEKEAKARGISKEQLVKVEIEQKVATVDEAAAQKWYDENQARVGGRPFEQLKGQIVSFLSQQSGAQQREAYLDTLREKAAVSITLSPPRVKLAMQSDDPAKGPRNAPVQIVEFSDFE